MWIIAILLAAIFAAAGFFQGAITALVTLIGVVASGLLAIPLGPVLFKWFLVQCGVVNPYWLVAAPPIVAFVVFILVFAAIGFAIQRPLMLHYKYRSDDFLRQRFEIMMGRVGACVGAVGGLICALFVCIAIYVPGYFTAQFATDNDPSWLKFINQARNDMQATGFDRVVSKFAPVSKNYYESADMVSVLYHNNPGIISHLADYPPLVLLGERQEWKDLINDKELMEFLQKQPGLAEVMENAKIQAVVFNADLTQDLLSKLDLKDLKAFIETGKSPKYDSFKILGQWALDADQILVLAKKRKPDIKTGELAILKQSLATMSAGTSFKATCDNKAKLTIKGNVIDLTKLAEMRANALAAAAARNAPPRRSLGAPTSIAANLRSRYATDPRYGAPPPAAAAEEPAEGAAPTPLREEVKTYDGTWDGEGGTYELAIRDDKGKEDKVTAMLDGYQLLFTLFGQQFVFVKQF
jgi:hypothetical protein